MTWTRHCMQPECHQHPANCNLANRHFCTIKAPDIPIRGKTYNHPISHSCLSQNTHCQNLYLLLDDVKAELLFDLATSQFTSAYECAQPQLGGSILSQSITTTFESNTRSAFVQRESPYDLSLRYRQYGKQEQDYTHERQLERHSRHWQGE